MPPHSQPPGQMSRCLALLKLLGEVTKARHVSAGINSPQAPQLKGSEWPKIKPYDTLLMTTTWWGVGGGCFQLDLQATVGFLLLVFPVPKPLSAQQWRLFTTKFKHTKPTTQQLSDLL